MDVQCELKILSGYLFGIHLASLCSYPCDRIFNLHLTDIKFVLYSHRTGVPTGVESFSG